MASKYRNRGLRRWALAGLVGSQLALAPLATAQQPAPMSVAQALQLRSVVQPQLGEDFVAFGVTVPRPIADGPGSAYQHVGVIDGLSQLPADVRPEPRWLVTGKTRAGGLAVRPGQRQVSYLQSLDDRMQVVLQSIDGGVAQRFANTPAVVQYRWRPDGQALAFTVLDVLPPLRAAARARGIAPVVVDEDWRHLSLWVVEAGGEAQQLTQGTTVFDFAWAPDGRRLACACAPRNLTDDSYMFTRLHLLEVATKQLTPLVDNPGKLGEFAWSPDGKRIAYVTAADRNDPHAGNLATVEVATGAVDLRVQPFSVEGLQWWRYGTANDTAAHSLLSLVALGTKSALLQVDVGAGRSPASPGLAQRTAITSFCVRGNRMVFAASSPEHAAELFYADLTAGDVACDLQRLTDSNPWLAQVALGEQSVERLRTRDGLAIEGVLIKPVGYRAGTRYPFVIVAHGGPEAHYSDGWLTSYSGWGQLLAARGYVSWYPNYRSSTGYGTAFCKHDHGDPMGKEFTDHLDAIAHFAAAGLIDTERVGLGGGSYGGYTAAWAATRHSEHFAAAVSFVPFVDIRTKWLTSDIPYEFYHVHYQELWPWQQPGLLADRSPLSWAVECRTPLLLLGGTSDPRVHPSQPFMLYRAVKFATSTPVRYVQYPGEGHGNRNNVNQLDYALRTLRWFDHYLQGPGDRRTKPVPDLDLDYD